MSALTDLQTKLHQLDRSLLQREGQYRAILESKTEIESEIQENKKKIELLERVAAVVQKLTEISRKDTLDKVAAIVSTAIQEVKDPNLSFKINYKLERNQAVADFMVYNKKLKAEMDIFESCGGTIADIVEFTLKVSLLLKWQPKLARVLVMDEQLKHISAVDKPAMARFVRQVSERLGIQIILVSHSAEFISSAHKVFSVSHNGTKSIVEVEESGG